MRNAAKLLVALVVLAVLALGALVVWYFVFDDDAPPEAALPDRTTTTLAGDEPPGGATTTTAAADVDGEWTVQTGAEVFVGYRIQELFAGETVKKTTAGRTPVIEGSMTVADGTVTAATFTADLTQLASDEERRDDRLRERGLQTDQFPDATFTLTEPIELGALPAVGDERSATAQGELLLHGVTRAVTVELTTRWNGDTIDVAGGAPIVLADYGIEPPDVAGILEVDDNGTFELQLTFVRATA